MNSPFNDNNASGNSRGENHNNGSHLPYEDVAVGIHWVNSEGIIIWANKTELDLLGYSHDEYVGHHISEFHADKNVIEDMLSRLNRKETLHLYEARILCKNGSIRHVIINSNVLWEDNKFIHTRCFTIDVTDQKKAGEKIQELLQTEQKARKEIHELFMQTPAIVCVLRGPKHIFELANAKYMELVEGRPILNKSVREVFPELEGQGLFEILDEVYKTGKPFIGNEVPIKINRQNGIGEERVFNFIYQPSRNIRGEIDGILIHATEVTEQVNARRKIEETNALFSTLANNIQNLAWIAEADGYIFWYNNRWYEYTGTTIEDMKGWGWQSVHDPEALPHVLSKWKYSIATGEPFEMTFPLKGADNKFRSFLTRVFPVRDNAGKIIRWIGTNTDIDDQKKAEIELEEKVKQRTLELEQANEELQSKNQEIALSKYNKRFLTEFSDKFSGYKRHTEFFNSLVQYIADLTRLDYVLIGKLVQSGTNDFSIHTIALTAFGKLVDNIIYSLPDGPCEQVISGTIYSYPSKCKSLFPKNKTIAEFNVEGYIGYPLYDAKGNAVGIIAVMHESDIGDPETVSSILKIVAKRTEIEMERITYEEALEKKTFQLVEAQQIAHIGSWEWNVTTDKIEWSDELFRIYGLLPQEFEATYENFLGYIHPDDRQYLQDTVSKSLKDHQPYKITHRIITKDNELRYLSSTGKVSTDSNGKVIKLSGTAQEVTEQVKYELELKDKNEQLEKMNKELQSFAYVSSHDLQEPLRKIQTFATRILDKEFSNLSDNGKDNFNRMFDAAKRMQKLIEDLLTYSKTSREDLAFELMDLRKIIDEVKEELSEELQNKNAILEYDELCSARIIPFQFRQLVLNIIGNSLKFADPARQIHIRIKSAKVAGSKINNKLLKPERKYCHIIFEDNGIGFQPEYSEKIFEVFQRLHSKDKYRGTGIGLSIVKKIVENHNGIIIAHGQPGHGATFEIFIPE